MKKPSSKSDYGLLRQKAEELIKEKNIKSGSPLPELEVLKLIQELEIHQIELELQNEELIRAKLEAQVAAEKYRELYDFAPTGYFTLSKEGKILELNFSGAKMLGKSRSQLINGRFGFFVSKETILVFNQFLQRIFENRTKETCETCLSSDGKEPICVNLTGIVTSNGEKCLMNALDITMLKLTENDLTKAKEKAQESERLKTAFLSNMSHEIRTPMNGILGFTELLKEPMLTAKDQQDYIDVIEISGVRMLKIINDIINISKLEAGQMEIFMSETNVNEQIKFINNFFAPEVLNKGIGLSIKNSLPAKEAIIRTDQDKINTIISNLVKNAIKFTIKGSIEIGYNKKGQFLEFFVKDTGIGIRPELLKVIFERFRKGSESHSLNYEGSGLGLSISKAYVEMLGGKIWAESQPGIGTVFYFTIPYNQSPSPKTNNKNAAPPAEDKIQLKKLKILIAEDDKISDMFISKAIERYSKEILKARTGVVAVEKCRKNPDIDLVLMDIRMPEMDGLEATRQIKMFNKNVIIIAQTAFGLAKDRENALKAGCDDYIAKPFSQNSLKKLIIKHFI